jgi:tRNA(fMet)-specific endonuclease VapC
MIFPTATILAQLERLGTPIGPIDVLLIAGVAMSGQEAIVTHNVGEFSRVVGLSIVDWY